ncbi:MAG: DUF4258 domain-containing protein [Ignavibacteriae bacterium]|nr:DUF4258 domain-containing protein [Ignavibacteriota bacterium]
MIEDIKKKIRLGLYEYSHHAVDQTIIRLIYEQEICEAIENGIIIEDYPEDKYGPSCLIFGLTKQERPLHIQCSYPIRDLIKIITVYEPDFNLWVNFIERKTK